MTEQAIELDVRNPRPLQDLVSRTAAAFSEGRAPAQIFNWLRSDDCTAEDAIAALLEALPAERHEEVRLFARGAPKPDFSRTRGGQVTIDGHTVQVLGESHNPRLTIFGNLLTQDECNELIATATSRLARSTVVGDDGSSVPHVARTSSGSWLRPDETPLCAALDARITALLDWPQACTESIQVLRYGLGEEYIPHQDYHRGDPWAPIFRRGGQRVATLVIYLNTPTLGGATVFPEVPLDVRPIAGNAVFFAYEKPHRSSRALHGGAPVTQGEKWAAVKWFRQGIWHRPEHDQGTGISR